MIGILTDDHYLAGRIPSLSKPVPLMLPEGAMWAVGPDRHLDIAVQFAKELLPVPLNIVDRLHPEAWKALRKRGATPPMRGAGRNQPAWRLAGTAVALSTTVKTHIYVVSSVTAGQQPPTFDFLETSCDGTTGNWTVTNEGSTHAGAGTPTASTVNITQMGRYPATASGTATGGVIGGNYSAEPSALVVFGAVILPLPTAPFAIQYPLGREIDLNNTASATMRGVAHRGVVSTGTPNMRSTIEIEE